MPWLPPSSSDPIHSLRLLSLSVLCGLAACGGGGGSETAGTSTPTSTPAPAPGPAASPSPSPSPSPAPADGGPAAGYASGQCAVPAAAQAVATDAPDHVVGNGSVASCTSDAVVAAVAQGGKITFNCGSDPVTIMMTSTAKVFNDKPDVVLDGGGKVTLSGGSSLRILYQNTCDPAQVWTTTRCDVQDSPKLTVQNITMVDGNSSAQSYGRDDVNGGGAIFVRGGRLKVVNSRFFRNQCEATGPDLGGGAVRAFGTSAAAPVYVVNSTFGGAIGYGNQCSNGGGLSGLGASYSVINTLISHNSAIGNGANPARAGTPGGGSGGAIYQDGNTFDLSVCGSHVHDNSANEGGGAFFFVSNDLTGTMAITDSLLEANTSAGFETTGLPGIFVLARSGQPVVSNSTIRK